jgi:dipeptidyl aminopeptidase/acylaminoacyl peptidase
MCVLHRAVVFVIVASSCAVHSTAGEAVNANHPWVPATSIAIRYFPGNPDVDAAGAAGNPWSGQDLSAVVSTSPDGRYALFVYHYGELQADDNVYELRVFRLEDLREELASTRRRHDRVIEPYKTLTLRSSSSRYGAIGSVEWSSDGDAVQFIGMSDAGTLQGFRLDLLTRVVTQMTHSGKDVEEFWTQGEGAIHFEDIPGERTVRYPIETISQRDKSGQLIDPDEGPVDHAMFVALKSGEDRRVVAAPAHAGVLMDPVWFAPDGHFAVAVMHVETAPAAWQRFGDVSPTSTLPWFQYMLIDLDRARATTLVDAPIAPGAWGPSIGMPGRKVGVGGNSIPNAVWSADSRHVVIASVALPPDEPKITSANPANVYTIEYDLRSGSSRIVDPPPSLAQSPPTDVRFRVKEDANEAPVIWASLGKNELALTEPDHALAGVAHTRSAPFSWQSSDGVEQTAGLWMPAHGEHYPPVPLVIQLYRYHPHRFLPDGYNATVDAAQALAARGIAVLELTSYDLADKGGVDEGTSLVARIDSVVSALAKARLIDPHRVAITGFSHGGYHALYAITHPGRVHLSAVICADSHTGSYPEYLWTYGHSVVQEWSGVAGNFWQYKDQWLRQETFFNLERVSTPALFTLNGSDGRRPQAFELAYQTIGAFSVNQRPMEYVAVPTGEHGLVRPRERLAMMTSVVDWMTFWLKGETPPDPERAQRWMKLREQQQAVLEELKSQGKEVAPLPALIAPPAWAVDAQSKIAMYLGDH